MKIMSILAKDFNMVQSGWGDRLHYAVAGCPQMWA